MDKASDKGMDRETYKAMVAFVRTGDTAMVERISRRARNTRELLSIIADNTLIRVYKQ